jgi:hypothetical protein
MMDISINPSVPVRMGAIIRRKKSEKDVEESQATGSGISLETRQWSCLV